MVALALVGAVALGAWYALYSRPPAFCEISGRPIHGNMHTLVKVDGKRLHACCARCALTLAGQARRKIEILQVTDYASGKRLPAHEAFYVEGSRVEVCSAPRLRVDESRTPYVRLFDRCAPSLLAFAQENEARAFSASYGGSLKRLDQLMREALTAESSAEEHRHD